MLNTSNVALRARSVLSYRVMRVEVSDGPLCQTTWTLSLLVLLYLSTIAGYVPELSFSVCQTMVVGPLPPPLLPPQASRSEPATLLVNERRRNGSRLWWTIPNKTRGN